MSNVAGSCLCCGCAAAAHHLTGWSDTGCHVHRWCRHFSPMPAAPRRRFDEVLRVLSEVFKGG
jgi:hypothetical protein